MYKQLEIDKLIEEDVVRCKELYKSMENLHTTLPQGSLILRNKKYYHSYREAGKLHRVLVENPRFMEQLKQKQFVKKGLRILRKRIAAGMSFLKLRERYDPIGIVESLSPVYRNMKLEDFFLKGDNDPGQWYPDRFERNTLAFKEEHYTANDVQVRSKSEAMIGTQLEQRNWRFICEPRLNFGVKIKCPDFAVMLPKTRKIIYIEHFGKMAEYSYVVDTMNKLVLYSKHGLRLGDNFFFTWESIHKPLNEREIADLLDRIALMDEV